MIAFISYIFSPEALASSGEQVYVSRFNEVGSYKDVRRNLEEEKTIQIINNIILNFLLIYPLIIINEYYDKDIKFFDKKYLINVGSYLFLANNIFIFTGFYLEAFLFFYFLFLIPIFVIIFLMLIKNKDIQKKPDNKTRILGIQYKRFAIIISIFILLIIGLVYTNNLTNKYVLQVHKNTLYEISNSEEPIKELIYKSENPSTLISEIEDIKIISEGQSNVIYSGNSKKIIRVTIKSNKIMLYDFTYRRNDSGWKLDGMYTMRETY